MISDRYSVTFGISSIAAWPARRLRPSISKKDQAIGMTRK